MAMTFSRRSTYSHTASLVTSCLFTDGIARKSKVFEALDRREARSLDPPLHYPVMAVYQLQLRQPQQVFGMVHSLGCALRWAILSYSRRNVGSLSSFRWC